MIFRIFLPLILFSSCTMVSYLTEQGIEQVKLQLNGRHNDEFLNDPDVSEEVKRKVLLVGEYKKFFYHYFGRKPTNIYDKTTILPNKAVTYLVIASPHTKISAHEFNFPLMGSFPYIGFFNKSSAQSFAQSLAEDQNLVTYIRPVYAYSTLGYFEDRILSSFFHYDDVELAELIFHELFHTIFFIKDEVDVNENLANLFGKALLREFFKERNELKFFLENEVKKEKLSSRVVELISILKDEFSKLGGFITDDKADIMTKRFVTEVFIPDLTSFCYSLMLPEEDCDIKEEWNQASFAAFLTYEEDQDFLKNLQEGLKLNLKDYLVWLQKEYDSFKEQSKVKTFSDHLKNKLRLQNATHLTD